MNQALEIKSRRRGWTISIVLHLLLLLIFWLYNIWPFSPPIEPNYGVEVNFGTMDVGSGDVQNDSPPSTAESEEIQETPPAEAAPSESAPAATEEVVEESDIQEDVETVDAETEVSATPNTEVVESITEPVETENTTPNTTETENVESESEAESESESTSESASQENNNGDDTDVPGDKGEEHGEINDSDIYKGKAGGGGGSGAQIAGWYTEGRADNTGNFKETGKIVFRIKIDDEGEMVSVTTIEKTVSSTVELHYKRQIERLSFIRKDDNDDPAPFSIGIYTVTLGSK